MYDIELVREILRQVLGAARTIAKRFAPITSPEDFVSSEAGLEKLDAICMQLIAIGESVKHLDKITEGTLLPRYPQLSGSGSWGCEMCSAIITSISMQRLCIRLVRITSRY